MSPIVLRQRARRVESLIRTVLGNASSFIGHLQACQTRHSARVALRVELVGASLVMRVYPTSVANTGPSLPTRKIETLHPEGRCISWLGLQDGKLYPIDPQPHLEQASPVLTCFHPLQPLDRPTLDESDDYSETPEAIEA